MKVSSWRDEAWIWIERNSICNSISTRWIFVGASGTFPQCKAKEIEGQSEEMIVKAAAVSCVMRRRVHL